MLLLCPQAKSLFPCPPDSLKMPAYFYGVVNAGFTVEAATVLPHILFPTDPLAGGLESHAAHCEVCHSLSSRKQSLNQGLKC